MIDLSGLSSRCSVRRMSDPDVDEILDLCLKNTLYYQYCGKQPSRDLILGDLHITPPGIDLSDKYYIGFYQGKTLVAVMDLIDGYPTPETAFIGFFMMNRAMQGQGLGSAIIQETAAYLKAAGKTAIRLAIDKGNPQSSHFWNKNGFHVIHEIAQDGWTVLVAEMTL